VFRDLQFKRRVDATHGNCCPLVPSLVGFQNRVEPHTAHEPRCTLSDDWYHLTDSAPRTSREDRLTLMPVQKLPVCFRHCVQ
jgi:hypothetical protein